MSQGAQCWCLSHAQQGAGVGGLSPPPSFLLKESPEESTQESFPPLFDLEPRPIEPA